jgi:DHA1 family multidrug resistance protein-like MFS transporter
MFGQPGRVLTLMRENERLTLILVSTALVMSGQGVMAPVLPLFASSFGVGAGAIGLTLSTFALARLILNVPLGILSDRYGRRILLAGGPVVSAVGMLGSGASSDLAELLGWRFVAGAGSAMYMTGAQVYLIDISTPATRARIIGANQGALLFGVSIGPAVGGLLAEVFGFRVPFYAVGAASLLTASFVYFRLPETHPNPTPRSEPPATHQPNRPAWLRLLSSRDFAAVAGVTFAVFLTRAGSRMTLMPLLAASSLGYSAGGLGGLFAVMAIINLLGVGPAAWVADRFGRKWAIVPAGVLVAAALLLMATAGDNQTFVAAALLLAIGTATIGPAPAAYVADIAPPDLRGLAMGLYRSAGDAGFLLGPIALGALADATSIQVALAANAGIFVVATTQFGVAARERPTPAR